MERFSFGAEAAFVPRGGETLERVTIAPLTPPIAQGSPVQVAVFRIAPGGGIPRHPGGDAHILAVLDGSGEVSGGSGSKETIAAGEAVFLRAGEEHELTSAVGMTVLVIQGDGIEPFRRPPGSAGSDPSPRVGLR